MRSLLLPELQFWDHKRMRVKITVAGQRGDISRGLVIKVAMHDKVNMLNLYRTTSAIFHNPFYLMLKVNWLF